MVHESSLRIVERFEAIAPEGASIESALDVDAAELVEKVGGRKVVAPRAVTVGHQHAPVCGDGHHAALLKRVAGHSALPVSTAAGPKPPRHHLHGRKAAETALHFHRLVRGFCGVSENPIKRGVVVGKVTQVVDGAVPDDRQAVSRLGDGSLGLDVVSDLLTAEESTKVPNESKDCGFVCPQAAEPDGFTVAVKNGERLRVSHCGLSKL